MRININIPDKTHADLLAQADKLGISVSALVNIAIADYMENKALRHEFINLLARI